jgi:hypothetical protein
MQRDQRSLEKALAQAGLDGQKTSLEFSLRQNPSGGGSGAGRELPTFIGGGSAVAEPETPPAPVTTLYRGTASPGGLNLFV